MCRHRFGVLNDMYQELQSEGYNEISMIGVNGFQYIDNDLSCMICDFPENCSNCDEIRYLPWVQDLDDVIILRYFPEKIELSNNETTEFKFDDDDDEFYDEN